MNDDIKRLLEVSDPRYLKMAKDRINQKRDYQCVDCGYTGLEAPDAKCPECGGQLSEPGQNNDQDGEDAAQSVSVTPADIRAAVLRHLQKKVNPPAE